MPVGIIINSLAILLGGITGGLFGDYLKEDLKENLNLIFGLAALGMGISAIANMVNMPAVIFALVLGTVLGLIFKVQKGIDRAAGWMEKGLSRLLPNQDLGLSHEEFNAQLLTIIVLFCASGTGIYGSLESGMTGDASILISKSILDFFTAMIFACSLGYIVSMIAIPQFLLFFLLFLSANLILPLTTPSMIGDFKACGGFLMLASGFRIMKLRDFPVADMIPAMILVMPISWVWTSWIQPLIGM
ncbi:putative inner membrane protein [Streptococcus gordonii]|uniref:Putative inner membrane protein n=1 Tax=Streptococcus gordonii TaxID=1302 RepID=A0A139N174_STRGN|nr:putative inner membrane protein [Streptococcus gordonii]